MTIAQMTLIMGQRKVVATLADDYRWSCDDLLTQTYLNECHGRPAQTSPNQGPPGLQQARRAARAVEEAGWTVVLSLAGLQQNAA